LEREHSSGEGQREEENLEQAPCPPHPPPTLGAEPNAGLDLMTLSL